MNQLEYKSKKDKDEAKEMFMLGLESYEKESYEEAEKFFTLSLRHQPNRLSTLINLYLVLIKLEKIDSAEELINRAISLHPTEEELYMYAGTLYENKKELQKALSMIEKALKINHALIEAHDKRNLILQEVERSDAAMLEGTTAAQNKKYDQAIALLNKSIEIDSGNYYAHNNLGNTFKELFKFNEALVSYEKAIKLKPDYGEAYYNRGIVLYAIKRFEEAVQCYRHAIKFMPNNEKTYLNLGNALQELNFMEEALINYEKAIELKPYLSEAYNNRGIVLKKLKRTEEALVSYERAIEIAPNLPEAYSNRGLALQDLNQLQEAIVSLNKAIELNPIFAEAYANRGEVLAELNKMDLALQSYEKAIKLQPEYEYLEGKILHIKMLMCNWQNFETELNDLLVKIYKGDKASPIFPVLALTDSLLLQYRASIIWTNHKYKINNILGQIPKAKYSGRIKIGYYSADFREHPVSYLIAELFELHDRKKIELIGFYFGPADSSSMHNRINSSFEKFINVNTKSDIDIAKISRKIGVDIAIDLTGITQYSRTGIFSYRAAPIQVSYLGFLGTMGAEYYDYLIADAVIIPAKSRRYYKEKIIYLPSYQVNDTKRIVSNKIFTKKELNLPDKGFVFCNFNNNYKITPPVFDVWMRILKKVPDSVIYLYAENMCNEINLKLEAEKRGVCKNRLIFGKRINRNEYLSRYRNANLFLDTLPYNAGATASDALWVGLPVLTCMGESFASRIAASLLTAIELPELITKTHEEYEAKAIELATNPEKLEFIKSKLEKNKINTKLFDSKGFAKNIELAFSSIYKRYQNELPPEHIIIDEK